MAKNTELPLWCGTSVTVLSETVTIGYQERFSHLYVVFLTPEKKKSKIPWENYNDNVALGRRRELDWELQARTKSRTYRETFGQP